jgi:hypothetical protein
MIHGTASRPFNMQTFPKPPGANLDTQNYQEYVEVEFWPVALGCGKRYSRTDQTRQPDQVRPSNYRKNIINYCEIVKLTFFPIT